MQGFLKEKSHGKAIKMLTRVLEVWGDVEELQVCDEEVEKMMGGDEAGENEDEADEEIQQDEKDADEVEANGINMNCLQ